MKKQLAPLIVSLSICAFGFSQPVNDTCNGATVIIIPLDSTVCIFDSTIGATATTWSGPVCGDTTWPHDVWYTFVTTGTQTTITLQTFGHPPAWQLGMALYTGSCASLQNVNCAVSTTDSGIDYIPITDTIGVRYWIEISSFADTGNFALCISSMSAPNAGTTCATAVNLVNLDSFTLAQSPAGDGNFSPACFTFPSLSFVWYRFTAGVGGNLSWSCTPTAPNTELDWALYDITSGGCAGIDLMNPLRCNYHYSGSLSYPIGMSDSSSTICPINSSNTDYWEEFCPSAPLSVCNTYVLFISNFSNNQSGWKFNFDGSTFQMGGGYTQVSRAICGGQSYFFNNQTLNQSGIYYDTLQATGGCDSIIALNLTVSNVLQTFISDSICTGGVYAFNGHSLTQGGIYYDTLQATGGCDSVVTLHLFVNSLPAPTISLSNDTLQTQGFASYQWLLNGSPITSATAQTITITQNGNYRVLVTNASGCSDTSAALNVISLGITDIYPALGVKVYPNPGNGNFIVEFPDKSIMSVYISNILGQPVASATQVTQKAEFDLSAMPGGVYILKATDTQNTNELVFKQVVVQH